jgi:hypothetical protein
MKIMQLCTIFCIHATYKINWMKKWKCKSTQWWLKENLIFEFENFETLFIKTHFVIGKALGGGPY